MSANETQEAMSAPLTRGAALIAAERSRQITQEGWTPEIDEAHSIGELCDAARCYLFAGDCLANASQMGYICTPAGLTEEITTGVELCAWPWEMAWLKISEDPVRNLVKAGALIAAEIDRLLRLAEKGGAA